MRILWVTNIKIPLISKLQGSTSTINVGGWLDRISKGVLRNKDNQLIICYPSLTEESAQIENLTYMSLLFDTAKMQEGTLNDEDGIKLAEKILSETKPDIIHIHGTEFQYHWFFAQAATNLKIQNRMVVSIQGLVGIYAKHYALGVPNKIISSFTFKELIKKNNIKKGIDNYIQRGKYEKRTIQLTPNIIGRTTWDRACTYRYNPLARYFVGNETLRENFYKGQWQCDSCVKNRIFISQAGYPVKGFHLFLDALLDIREFYPDVTVHVAGTDLTKSNWLKGSTYANYIQQKMKKYGLNKIITFCGSLNAEQMKKEMLEANVFVSPSTIENSPNSVGEAMLLGVPVVSSGVGGVMDLLKHGVEGFIYQSDAPYMLAYYVGRIFDDNNLAIRLGKAAHARANITHDYEKNLRELLEIYNEICEGNQE